MTKTDRTQGNSSAATEAAPATDTATVMPTSSTVAAGTETEIAAGTTGDAPAPTDAEINMKAKNRKRQFAGEDPFTVLAETTDLHKELVETYGLTRPFFDNFSLCIRAKTVENARSVYLLNDDLKMIVAGNADKVATINGGIKIFSRAQTPEAGAFMFRPTQEGIDDLAPYITKRRHFVSAQEVKMLLEDDKISLSLLSETLVADLAKGSNGPVVLTYDPSKEDESTKINSDIALNSPLHFAGWIGAKCLRLFIKRDERKSLIALVLNPESVLEDEVVEAVAPTTTNPVVEATTTAVPTTATTNAVVADVTNVEGAATDAKKVTAKEPAPVADAADPVPMETGPQQN